MFFPNVLLAIGAGECNVADSDKVDCGYFGINQEQCEGNGCCWKESNIAGVPYCFHKVGESEGSHLVITCLRNFYILLSVGKPWDTDTKYTATCRLQLCSRLSDSCHLPIKHVHKCS